MPLPQQPPYDATDETEQWIAVPGDEIVYGALESGAVYIPRRYAEGLASLRTALASSTWGELRRALSPDAIDSIRERISDLEPDADGVEPVVPTDDERFTPEVIWGFADGDWPAWPAQRMLDWVPVDIWQRYGQESDSVFNGEFLEVPTESIDAMADALRATGFVLTRDDSLVASASGY
jgi:hypothetical protein